MKKLVNGELVDFTQADIADLAARQATAQAEAAERIRQEVIDGTQAALNAFAKTRNYDGILSACTYATSTIPAFAEEGQYCVQLRDETWAALYEMLAEVQAGHRPVPASFEDIADELPVTSAVWP